MTIKELVTSMSKVKGAIIIDTRDMVVFDDHVGTLEDVITRASDYKGSIFDGQDLTTPGIVTPTGVRALVEPYNGKRKRHEGYRLINKMGMRTADFFRCDPNAEVYEVVVDGEVRSWEINRSDSGNKTIPNPSKRKMKPYTFITHMDPLKRGCDAYSLDMFVTENS